MDGIEQDNSAIVMGDEFEGFSEHTMVDASTEKNGTAIFDDRFTIVVKIIIVLSALLSAFVYSYF